MAVNNLSNAHIPIFLVVFTIIGTRLVLFSESRKRSCSFSQNTALTTDHCPSSRADWSEREKVFNCASYQQNCTTPNLFLYHWVPNAWRNACVEVCAIKTFIVGYKCPEFNFGGQMVQENNRGKCESCPFIYNSNEVYKYMECFEFANGASSITDVINKSGPQFSTAVYEIESECSGFECFSIAVGLSVAVLFGCIVITSLIFFLCKKYTCRLRQNVPDPELQGYTCNYKTSEEIIPLKQKEENNGSIPNSLCVDDALHTGYFSQNGHSPAIPVKQEATIRPEDEPEYKTYKNYETRFLSFSGFSLQDMKKGLAYAGFYYEGYALATKCFQCGCSKEDWEIGDDAIMEHFNLNASCPYLRYLGKNNDLPLQHLINNNMQFVHAKTT